jgi:hypothetical protein
MSSASTLESMSPELLKGWNERTESPVISHGLDPTAEAVLSGRPGQLPARTPLRSGRARQRIRLLRDGHSLARARPVAPDSRQWERPAVGEGESLRSG